MLLLFPSPVNEALKGLAIVTLKFPVALSDEYLTRFVV
jgi:hypothetical protein